MKYSILLDFGSTFTKAAVVDMEAGRLVYATKAPSSVSTDANIALDECFRDIEAVIGKEGIESAAKLATSSAAGGLRMAVIGLTETLSITAARNASFGAGAKIMKCCTGLISDEDIRELEKLNIEIILLCGGYEGGNVTAVRHNAQQLAHSTSRVPVIYAGNSALQREVKILFQQAGKECFCVSNIIPNVGVIDSKPTEDVIRNIFLERIVNMKGLDKIKSRIDRLVMPTPSSVLEAGELLSLGTEKQKGLGSLMIIDIGGATTDIHSYCWPLAALGAKIIGSPEPYAKRTVEGDLGMRESSGLVISEVGYEKAAQDLGISVTQLEESINKRLRKIKYLPKDEPDMMETELNVDTHIAKYAARLATRRHCGYVEAVHSKTTSEVQHGKNLEEVTTIIGTGGPIINSADPKTILAEALENDRDIKMRRLLPKEATFMVDGDYIFYAAGILKEIDPEAAMSIMKNSLRLV